jgi:hypothetical protein
MKIPSRRNAYQTMSFGVLKDVKSVVEFGAWIYYVNSLLPILFSRPDSALGAVTMGLREKSDTGKERHGEIKQL